MTSQRPEGRQRLLLCLNSGSAFFLPSKDPASLVFQGEYFGETLLAASTVVKWDGPAFGAFSVCVTRCYSYVTISATQTRESDNLLHTSLQFSLFLFFFFGRTKNLGTCEATKDNSRAPSQKREKKAAFVRCVWRSPWVGTAFAWCCDVIDLQMRPPKDADRELRHSNRKARRDTKEENSWKAACLLVIHVMYSQIIKTSTMQYDSIIWLRLIYKDINTTVAPPPAPPEYFSGSAPNHNPISFSWREDCYLERITQYLKNTYDWWPHLKWFYFDA